MSEHHFTWIDELKVGSYALLSDDPSADTAVVFVHGFLGDAEGTWLNFQGMIDTHSRSRQEWQSCDVFFFQYPSFRQSISDSAEDLVAFLEGIFPVPPEGLFRISKQLKGLPSSLVELSLQPHHYKMLILVGHSEGAVVIRRAVVWTHNNESKGATHAIMGAQLALFAPAHLGFTPAGWIGACLATARIEALAMTILSLSPAFIEMKDARFLNAVLAETTEIFRSSPHLRALRARVLFGRDERIVVRGEYPHDNTVQSESGRDHTTICKPTMEYDRPLTFVLIEKLYA